jgi:hypothetical protein
LVPTSSAVSAILFLAFLFALVQACLYATDFRVVFSFLPSYSLYRFVLFHAPLSSEALSTAIGKAKFVEMDEDLSAEERD